MTVEKFIAVSGNIGVGKTTLTRLLGEYLDGEPFCETAAENPYLSDFYQNMERWSFHSQVHFLTQSLKQHKIISMCSNTVIQDRTIYEDAEIFAKNLVLQGLMSDRDFQTYWRLYLAIIQNLRHPDLVIYLKASVPTLLDRIYQRNRDCEQDFPQDYLHQLNRLYEDWINNFTLCPVLIIPSDDLDFVASPSDLTTINSMVDERLNGSKIQVLG